MKLRQWLAWSGVVGLAGVLMGADGDLMVRGKGVEIRGREVDAMLERAKVEAVHQGIILTEEQQAALRVQLLERLVLVRLCEVRATPADRRRARQESGAFIDGLKKERGEEGFARLLKMAGYTLETFEADKLSEAVVSVVIEREVKSTIRIPSVDIQEYYDRHPERWMEPAAVRFLHLQLMTGVGGEGGPTVEDRLKVRARMDGLLKQLERGADFAGLVREHSEDLSTKSRGGEYRSERGELPIELESEVFRLEPGKTSGVIESPLGLHVVRILERIPPGRIPLERVEEQIREVLVQRELPLRMAEFVERARREAGMEVLMPAGTRR
jgi:hypothetical protein